MSRRSQRRRSARGISNGKRRKWPLRISVVLLIVMILSGFGFYAWVKSYLHSDEFRVFMGDSAGKALGSEAHFELFEWQGMRVRTAGFRSESGVGRVRGVRASEISAKLALGGVKRGVWEVSDVRVRELDIRLVGELKRDGIRSEEALGLAVSAGGEEGAKPEDEKGFLQIFLPDRAEVKSLEVVSADMQLQTEKGRVKVEDMSVFLEQGQSFEDFVVNLSGGKLVSDWFPVPLYLRDARGKWRAGRAFLTDSQGDVYKRGKFTLSGEFGGEDFGFYGTLKDVRAEELVPEGWSGHVSGDVSARFKIHSDNLQSEEDQVAVRGEVQLKNGILTALPVLDHIAAYANTRRFRRLILSEASCKFRKAGDLLELSEVVLASEGLVRLVGHMTIDGGRLDGRFRVGVIPGLLAHIPGAETKVFVRGEKGLLWAPLRVSGTVDAPEEDLSKRMIAAAGGRMFELLPETGTKVLKFAHSTGAELPKEALDASAKVIKGDPLGALEDGAEVIRQGVGGLFDLVPGGAGGSDVEQENE